MMKALDAAAADPPLRVSRPARKGPYSGSDNSHAKKNPISRAGLISVFDMLYILLTTISSVGMIYTFFMGMLKSSRRIIVNVFHTLIH